jgi:hypothetical protein
MRAIDAARTSLLVELTAEEHTELLELLDQAFRDVRVEARRTETPAYRDEVHHRESILRGLLEKLRGS